METAKNGFIGLQDSQFGDGCAYPHRMAEGRSQIPNTRIIGKAVFNVLIAQMSHRSASLGAGSECPLEHGRVRYTLLANNDRFPSSAYCKRPSGECPSFSSVVPTRLPAIGRRECA